MNHLENRLARVKEKVEGAEKIKRFFQKVSVGPDEINSYLANKGSKEISQKGKLHQILLRPHITMSELGWVMPRVGEFLKQFDKEIMETAEINMKYAGYIKKEQEMVDKMNRLESVKLHEHIDYHEMTSLSSEAREKLTAVKPMTIGQASRISGVSPSDISVLLVYMGR